MNLFTKIVSFLAIIALSLTPFYSLAYVLAIAISVQYIGGNKIFSSVFSKSVIATLVMLASIMIAGMFFWLAGIKLVPLLIIGFFGAVIFAIKPKPTESASKTKLIDKQDVLSVSIAVIAPLIIVASFFLPKPSAPETYQLLSNGWDNANHLSMIVSVSAERGYVYGDYEELKEKIAIRANAYPQAWHLATSNFANGFGVNLFNPSGPIVSMSAYSLVLLLWYVVAAFLFTKIGLHLSRNYVYTSPNRKTTLINSLIFATISTAIQLVVLWGALGWGFANYIGCITYILATVAFIIHGGTAKPHQQLIIILLLGSAAILCWFLVLPAIALSILLWILAKRISIFKPSAKNWIKLLPIVIICATAIISLLAVFYLYSHVDGQEQINAGTIGGTFPISQLLVGVVLVGSLYYAVKTKSRDTNPALDYLSVVAPMLILSFSLYAHNIFAKGEVSYYFGKVAGITLLLAGVFFVAMFMKLVNELRSRYLNNSQIFTLLAGIGLVFLLLIGTGQSLSVVSRITKDQSKVPYETAKEITNYLKTADHKNTELLVFRNKSDPEDTNGALYMTVLHKQPDCLYGLVDAKRVKNIEQLGTCLKSLDKNIVVITSNNSKDTINSFGIKNLEIINLP